MPKGQLNTPIAKLCKKCGKEFLARTTRQKYCSSDCYCGMYIPRSQEPITKICIECGQEFKAVNGNQRYCCYECMIKANSRKAKMRTPQPKAKLVCAWCGSDFECKDPRTRCCSFECRNTRMNVRLRIINLFTFESEKQASELERLEKLGRNYSFPEPFEQYNGLYGLGEK